MKYRKIAFNTNSRQMHAAIQLGTILMRKVEIILEKLKLLGKNRNSI